jgi:transposase
MLTGMTERDWLIVLEVFDAAQSNRGEPGHDDRKFLEALHYFTVHSITWRALPGEFGKWNSVWKRFWRLSRSGIFEAFFQLLAECSQTAHLVQFFDSTTARAHVSAAGAKDPMGYGLRSIGKLGSEPLGSGGPPWTLPTPSLHLTLSLPPCLLRWS